MKIIATAFTCEPNLGSEYEVGWRWSQALGKFSDSLVLVRKKSFDNLVGLLIDDDIYGPVKIINSVKYKSIDFPFLNILLGERILMRTHYFFWMILCLIWIRLHKTRFDFNHHICFVAPWCPPITYFSGLPFVWGPIGTGAKIPSWIGVSLQVISWNVVTQILSRYNPLMTYIKNRSKAVFPINEHVNRLICGDRNYNSHVIPAIAADGSNIASSCNFSNIDTATIIFSGRNVPFKMPLLTARVGAILLSKYPNLKFIMIGEGLRNLSDKIDCRISILEPVDQISFQLLLTKANLLLFPTTEGSGFVALEALAVGLPIVCLEDSGPHDFINGVAGISCPIKDSMEGTALSLAAACERLLSDRHFWEQCSNMAIFSAKKLTWNKLESRLKNIYCEMSASETGSCM